MISGRQEQGRARWLAVSAAVACGLTLGVAPAVATNDFGTRTMSSETYGSRVSINTPSSTYFQAADEFVLHRAVSQSGFNGASDGLVQAGIYRSGASIQLDNCGSTAGGYYRYTEYKAFGTGQPYVCQVLYSAGALTPGMNLSFEVYRTATTSTWSAMINGVVRGTFSVAFNTAVAQMGGEIADVDNDRTTVTAAQYGPSGTMGWSYYASPNRSGATAVTSATLASPRDAWWNVPQPPTPLTVRHR